MYSVLYSPAHAPATYRDALKTISRLIAADACSIFSYNAESPIIRAAFRTSLHISSRRTIVRTMLPSWTSVIVQMSENSVPFAHSLTTSVSPKRSVVVTYSSGANREAFLELLLPGEKRELLRALARFQERPVKLRRGRVLLLEHERGEDGDGFFWWEVA